MVTSKLALQALIFGAALWSVTQGLKCKVTGTGLTWSYVPGRDIFSVGIPTEQECRELCSAKSECKGYSWRFDNVIGWCYEFGELEGIHVCDDCHSGTLPTRFNGNCDTDPENFIALMSTPSAEDCHGACTDTDGCMGFTWFDESTIFQNYCFLYSECSTVESCAGCSGGSMNCFGPRQCFDYFVLDSEQRNENHGIGYTCDTTQKPGYQSVDWKGPGHYRILSPAGNGIATKTPGLDHCGARGVFYISDDNNVIPDMKSGDEVQVKVCFDAHGHVPCFWYKSATVTKCPEDYFVYELFDLPVQACNSKYCTSFDP